MRTWRASFEESSSATMTTGQRASRCVTGTTPRRAPPSWTSSVTTRWTCSRRSRAETLAPRPVRRRSCLPASSAKTSTTAPTTSFARRTAQDRVISTVDTDARHGRKSSAQGFDGYKGNIAIDPDSEIITAASVGAANKGDADSMPELLGELEDQDDSRTEAPEDELQPTRDNDDDGKPVVYGDSAYGSGKSLALLDEMGAIAMTKVQAPNAPDGHFSKDRFLS